MKVILSFKRFLKSFYCFILSAIILSGTISAPVFAVVRIPGDRDDEFGENNIVFYNPDGTGSNHCICTPGVGAINSGDVLIIGDSITNGSQTELKEKLPDAEIIAQDSKQFAGTNDSNKTGIQILKEMNDSDMRKAIVLALGTNGSVSANDIKDAIDLIGDSRTLVLVTNHKRGDPNAYNGNNQNMKNAASSNANVRIADWDVAVKSDDTKYITDADGLNVHPTAEGKKLFAQTIASALGGSSSGEGSGSVQGENKLYNGDPILTQAEINAINENKPFYEKSAAKYNIPWQLIATLHWREHGSARSNPSNGQGAYQLYSYTNGGTNDNAFLPAGPISDDEFQRQTDIVAQLIRDNYGAGLNLQTDDGVKTFFFGYNGKASAYIAQARSMGFSEAEAQRGEGSPYVMNLADERRDSRKNPNWKQIRTDGGPMVTAETRPGAFLVYAFLGGATGWGNCICDGSSIGGNMDINQTAIDLAWPERGHGLTPTTAYRNALHATGIDSPSIGDSCSQAGNSCDAFVATVFRYSGVDPDFKCCGVSNSGATGQYVRNSGKFIEVPNTPESLKPGDIRLSSGHIEIYVEVNGVGKIASASHCERTGEIGNFYTGSEFKAYRWKGN